MTSVRADVLIIGAGVSGLTTAVLVAEAGLAVHVRTATPPSESTSCAAGAIWDPLYASHERVPLWSGVTYRTLAELSAAAPDSGVRLVDGTEASRTRTTPAEYAPGLPGYRPCAPGELPPGFTAGWRYSAPVVDMPVYLEYLQRRLKAAGGTMAIGHSPRLAGVAGEAPVVVNCTGPGAGAFVPDPLVVPIRGQLVVVENPGIEEFFAEHTDDLREMTYLLPQGQLLLLGGSAETGRADVAEDARIAAGIVDRCARVDPRIAALPVVGHRIGIRPARDPVRVEHELVDGHHVVHNYGHGGAGVSLSWGCAAEVRDVVTGLLR
ncbi:FAD-dependent oxidoreductase [Catenuloplanes atrovinosus]|uniref:D-amino-acid oxidase n=1 Tax=Catenuloplanes atrovinosus TaxID=137266 RepID=A0AAE4C7G1_9ACTN|nr:FAD-dependent oxidoreductase [Catenuloplanes atrovinosus]MDR7273838.1 D-amino-acid oxidase [Catenuloplanes atrovinosus]